MTMIYTCTLNPSVDYYLHVPQFKQGVLNRARSTHFEAGGKGINVSRALAALGCPSVAFGFIAGFTGEWLKQQLEIEGIRGDFLMVKGNTRINVKLQHDFETELNGVSPVISTSARQALLKKVENQLQANDVLVLAGSVPDSLDSAIYLDLARVARDKGAQIVLDTDDPKAIRQVLSTRPLLVKPNHVELGALFGKRITDAGGARFYARKLVAAGAQNVIVSLGEKGAVFVRDREEFVATPPRGEVIHSIGAGDATVAGFLTTISEYDPVTAFRYAVAAGSGTVFSKKFCTRERMKQLFSHVQIKQIRPQRGDVK